VTARKLKKFGSGEMRDKDVPHLSFLSKILKSSLQERDLSETDKTRLAEMIEAEHARLNPIEEPLDENGDQL
jgi:hypothetical protein